MSIVKMSRLTVVGLTQDKQDVIEALMKLGAIELDVDQPQPEPEDEIRQAITETRTIAIRQDWLPDEIDLSDEPDSEWNDAHAITLNAMSRLELAIEFCRHAQNQSRKSPTGKVQVDSLTFLQVGEREEDIMKELARLEKSRFYQSELKNKRSREQTRLDLLLPWAGLDIDLSMQGTETVRVFVGSMDRREQVDQLEESLAVEAPESHIEVYRQDESHVLLAVAVWRPRQDAVQALLRRLGFRPMPLQNESGTATELLANSQAQLEELEREIAGCEQDLTRLAERQHEFELLHDFYLVRSEKLKALREISGSKSTFWLTGWVPTNLCKAVEKGLTSHFLVAIESRPAHEDETYPILLHNSRFVKPYEVIVEMFSPPSTKDIDPAPLLAPFFFFFFGMMLSDVGYGLVLSVLCGLLIWKVKAKGELGRMARMLFVSGIGSILWGFVFGGFFGDMLTVLSNGAIQMPAIWFNPMDAPTTLMIWSMIFGVIHLFAGMGARIYMLAKAGHLLDGLLDIAPWYLIITGLGLLLGGFGGQVGLFIALAGVLVLLLFGGRDAKNPVMRLLKGLISIYGITGYFSDILSYTRILALVLATSVIAMVVNLLGFLLGPTPGGIILFIVVALAGHTLNLALSALSAYVHTSRLQYVEFFSKFYEGGGRLWKPLRVRTRYVEIVKTKL